MPDHVYAYRGDTATWLSEPAGRGPVMSTGRSRAFLKTLVACGCNDRQTRRRRPPTVGPSPRTNPPNTTTWAVAAWAGPRSCLGGWKWKAPAARCKSHPSTFWRSVGKKMRLCPALNWSKPRIRSAGPHWTRPVLTRSSASPGRDLWLLPSRWATGRKKCLVQIPDRMQPADVVEFQLLKPEENTMRRNKTALQYFVMISVLLSAVVVVSEKAFAADTPPDVFEQNKRLGRGGILATFCIDSKHGIRKGKWSTLI